MHHEDQRDYLLIAQHFVGALKKEASWRITHAHPLMEIFLFS